MSKGLLVTYGGYPYTPSSLFPDNGLANMAATLRAAGQAVVVRDLNTVRTMERLMTPALRARMRRLHGMLPRVGRDAEASAFARALDTDLEAHMARVCDALADELVAELRAGAFGWMGFKLYMGDGFRNSVRMAERVKAALPGVKVFAGGPQVDLVKGAIFRRTQAFDALAIAEGERTIVPLAEHVDGRRALADVPNILWQDGATIRQSPLRRVDDLDELALPCYDADVYPALAEGGKIRVLTYDESRGCPNRCPFCVHGDKSGVQRRVKAASRVADELAALRASCDTRVFRFAGSSTPYSMLVELSERLIAQDVDVLYSLYGTLHGLDPRTLPTLTAGGMWGIFFGVESGSPRLLQSTLGKPKNRVAEMERTIAACLDAGLFVAASLIYPAPGEDASSTEETLAFLRRVFGGRQRYSIPLGFAGLFPTTQWFRERERFGFSIEDEEAYLQEVMDYRIKSLMPFSLWPQASYALDGKPQPELARQTGAFMARLRAEGFTTMLLDDTALIATLAGIPLDGALDELVSVFLTGEIDAVRALVDTVNARVAVGGGPLPRAVPERADVAA